MGGIWGGYGGGKLAAALTLIAGLVVNILTAQLSIPCTSSTRTTQSHQNGQTPLQTHDTGNSSWESLCCQTPLYHAN